MSLQEEVIIGEDTGRNADDTPVPGVRRNEEYVSRPERHYQITDGLFASQREAVREAMKTRIYDVLNAQSDSVIHRLEQKYGDRFADLIEEVIDSFLAKIIITSELTTVTLNVIHGRILISTILAGEAPSIEMYVSQLMEYLQYIPEMDNAMRNTQSARVVYA